MNVYWIGDVEKAAEQFLGTWKEFLKAAAPLAHRPTLPSHCTIAYHEGSDVWYGRIWEQEVGQQLVQLVVEYAVVGPEGVALAVQTNPFIRK